jgi:hypothetical protein
MTEIGKIFSIHICSEKKKALILHHQTQRELAEWSIAAVLKTVDCNRSGGSNPSLSTEESQSFYGWDFYFGYFLFRNLPGETRIAFSKTLAK